MIADCKLHAAFVQGYHPPRSIVLQASTISQIKHAFCHVSEMLHQIGYISEPLTFYRSAIVSDTISLRKPAGVDAYCDPHDEASLTFSVDAASSEERYKPERLFLDVVKTEAGG